MFQRIQFRSLVVRCVGAALAAGDLVATVPRCAKAEDSAQARRDRCTAAQQDAARPPGHFTRVLLRVLQPSIEPVPATDGLIHLAHAAQVRNVRRQPVDILEVMAVDPLAIQRVVGRSVYRSREAARLWSHAFTSCKRKRNRTLRLSCATPIG